MSSYTSFAVIGTSGFASYIIKALLATTKAKSIIVLGRSSSTAERKVPSGVQLVKVDYSDSASLTNVFKTHQVDVVISAIADELDALLTQKSIGEAAKKADVKLFVPSEYGKPTAGYAGQGQSIFAIKDEIAIYLKSLGLPTIRIYNWLFTEYIPWVVGYDVTGKFNIIGKDEVPFPTTSEEDVSGFIAYILTELPASEIADKQYILQGDKVSLVEVAKMYGKDVVHVEKIPGDRSEFRSLINSVLSQETVQDDGKGGSEAVVSASTVWVGHHWKTVRDVLGNL